MLFLGYQQICYAAEFKYNFFFFICMFLNVYKFSDLYIAFCLIFKTVRTELTVIYKISCLKLKVRLEVRS